MYPRNRGFTLIELMITVAIIALLSAVALPLIVRQQVRAAEASCLAETKTYVSMSLAAMANQDAPQAPPLRACGSGDTISAVSTTVTGTPRSPGMRRTICSAASATCALEP
ncbi:pilin [Lysobacter humi (ex Lee et al. 2017)]